jgi:hypothetical protein
MAAHRCGPRQSRRNDTVKMSLAEEERTRVELMRREEPVLRELRPFVRGNMLRHPLIIEDIGEPDHAALVNARYREVKTKAEVALEKGDWSMHIALHQRPYRLKALKNCVDSGLSGSEYWHNVGDVWIDSGNIFQGLREWKKVWCSNESGREACMDDKERAALADLPEWFRVWRGTAHQRSVRGLSWTTDKEKAEWFARRLAIETQPLLAQGTVAKKDVKAVFLGRGESEVVSLGVRIEKVMTLEPDAVEREPKSIGELFDELRSGTGAKLRSVLQFN